MINFSKTQAPDIITEAEVIDIFNQNEDKFFAVQKFAASLDVNLYVDIFDKSIDINEQSFSKEVVYIIKNLNFVGIYSDKDNGLTSFVIKSGSKEQGILFIESNTTPELSPSTGLSYKIIDHWYYYEHYHV